MKNIFGNFKKKLDLNETIKLLEVYEGRIKQLKLQKDKIGFCVQKDYYNEAMKVLKHGTVFVCNLEAEEIKTKKYKAVLLGHSDYRAEGETNAEILKKIKLALSLGMKVIYCIGETYEENQAKNTLNVINEQIKGLDRLELANIIIAYEPVYAISTAKNFREANFDEVVDVIGYLQRYFNYMVPILYGGSVNRTNANEWLKTKVIDGALIGAASLDADNFMDVAKIGK